MERIYTVDLKNISDERLQSLQQQYMENPMSLLEVDEQDAKHLDERLHSFLKNYLSDSGARGYFIALSGGLDSSLCAYLVSESVGSENCFGARLPSRRMSSEGSLEDAYEVAKRTGMRLNDHEKVLDTLDQLVDLVMGASEIDEEPVGKEEIRIGNNYARGRMMIARTMANYLGYLVVGTTNATEAWLAYFTTAGDGKGGVDIEPIIGLPKTSERMYASHKGLPGSVISKAPSAELWEGQTDEDELSRWIRHPVSYETIDRVMVGVKLGLSEDKIVKANNHPWITKEVVQRLAYIAEKRAFKNKPEPSADLTR